uniref:Uncharacterized protein n=1 Tax=Plectus sambesii TaxID=2011161 RepID=A0A914WHX8_9BILA
MFPSNSADHLERRSSRVGYSRRGSPSRSTPPDTGQRPPPPTTTTTTAAGGSADEWQPDRPTPSRLQWRRCRNQQEQEGACSIGALQTADKRPIKRRDVRP